MLNDAQKNAIEKRARRALRNRGLKHKEALTIVAAHRKLYGKKHMGEVDDAMFGPGLRSDPKVVALIKGRIKNILLSRYRIFRKSRYNTIKSKANYRENP